MEMTFFDKLSSAPANLQALLNSGQLGYLLKNVYYLKLTHGPLKEYPAVYKKNRDKMVLTTDFALIKRIWETLPPRKSDVGVATHYVNAALGIGFPVLGPTRDDNEMSEPQLILTVDTFKQMASVEPKPFEWAPGLAGEEVSQAEFLRTVFYMQEHMTETA